MTARTAGIAWLPEYEGDEVALGIALAFALHAIPVAAIILRVYFPGPLQPEEQPFVSQPVIGANLLKLGKPIDPKQLPDRIVPRARTAPQQKIVASREDPTHKPDKPDAGPPPPTADDSDITRLIAKSDPFAEKNTKERPEQGFLNGSDAGTETDPSKAHAGDAYGAMLTKFFQDRWQIPTVISEGEERKLCVYLQVAVDPRMQVWFVKQAPDRPSGNDLFDDSARSMLQTLADTHTALPQPPAEIAEQYEGRRIQLKLGKGCR